MFLLPLFVACTSPEPSDDRGDGGADSEPGPDESVPPATTGATGETGDTGPIVPPLDCSLLVAAADVVYTSTREIVTEEDFDFDGQGYLLTQRSNDLQGIDRNGVSHFVAANIGPDATGIRSTAQGYIVAAQPSDGSIRLIDPGSGSSLVLLSDLTNPNGLEAGEDGMVYVTENTNNGRLRMVDPTNGDSRILLRASWMNGVVLSPDDQTLYLASSTSPFSGQTRIVSIERDSQGNWDESTEQVIYTHPAYVGSITIDACGNLYGLEYSQGRVFRLDTATLAPELFLDLGRSGAFSAIHFSPGIDGWDVNAVYVTSRGELFEIPTGIPGSHVLTP